MANSNVWDWYICEAELPCDSEAKNDIGRAGCGKTARPVRRGGAESGLERVTAQSSTLLVNTSHEIL